MGRPYSIDNYLKVKFTQSLNGVVSKMYNTDQKNDKHVPRFITLSNLSSPLEFLLPAATSVGTDRDLSEFLQRGAWYRSCANVPLFGSFSEGLANTTGYLGRTPSWPPRGAPPQRRKARPSQAKASCCNGASGSRGALSSVSARHGTASATHKKSQCIMQTCVLLLF